MRKFITLLFVCIVSFTFSQMTLDTIFRNSFTVFDQQRLPNGMYRDAKLFTGTDYHPISIANTGMGLISICIAQEMGWITDGENQVIQTLRSVTGLDPVFKPDRTTNGYYRHFMDIETGAQAWDSEYSTIDTDILVSGALFCANYFDNTEIDDLTSDLWESIDFEASIKNISAGEIYLSMNADGTGTDNSITLPYNEYMIVAWLAKLGAQNETSIGSQFWDEHYETTENLRKIDFMGSSLLTDNQSRFLPSFTHQFNYFLCHHFSTSTEYLGFFKSAQEADKLWWDGVSSESSEWGSGAGSSFSLGYHADAINNNPDTIYSPHIIAGFLPVYEAGKNDLVELWNSGNGKYDLTNNQGEILWRASEINTAWIPNEIIGVDYASMLFGLASLPEYLGTSFFIENNDFKTSKTVTSLEDNKQSYTYELVVNPVINDIQLSVSGEEKRTYEIYSISGFQKARGFTESGEKIDVSFLSSGSYVLKIEDSVYRFVKL